MSLGAQSEASLDTSSISAELLLLTLEASRAGLFYSPLLVLEKENLVMNSHHKTDPNEAWSLNIGPLFGLQETLKDVSEWIHYIVESDVSILTDSIKKAFTEKIRESDCEYRIRRPDGEIRWMLSRVLLEFTDEGMPRYLASMMFDITEQKLEQERLEQANLQLKLGQRLLRTALEASGIAIFRNPFNQYDTILKHYEAWNFNLDRLFGYPAGTKMTRDMEVARMQKADYEAIRAKTLAGLRKNQLEYQHEFAIEWDDKSVHWLLSKYTIETDGNSNPIAVSGAIIDISDRKLAEEETKYLATHDMLTRLPNRFMLNNLLTHTIETAKRYSNHFAVFFIDLDRFKAINDALGHYVGDQLLINISQRLQRCLRKSDMLARISGDEFVLVAPDIYDEESAGMIARKIISETSRPVNLSGQECQVTASIGISLFPLHGQDEATLLKHADTAMYIAKEAGKNNFQFYNADNTSQSLERLMMENELRSALEKGELHLHYQAKVELAHDTITGVETLLRWSNPKLGSIPPAVFIPVIEDLGLIEHIGRWILIAACEQNVKWQQQGLPPVCISVNLSARQFASKKLLKHIKEALQISGLDPKLLELEITESMVMRHIEEALAQLNEIKKLGVRIAIDDFGTGYSSLAQLKRLPIDTLKVDRSFIREVAHDTNDQAITDAIISMGKSLSLTIIAEGVETHEQHEFLRKHACDEMQGYYFSKPVSAAEFSKLLRSQSKVVKIHNGL